LPVVDGCAFIPTSDLVASFVENIRVRRFVMEGFSGCGARVAVDFCGSDGGAAVPFPLFRFSRLGTAIPWCFTGRDSGDPTADDV
jgi:hypothetical protein